jgi:Zn-dependent protease with chaperone function
MEKTGEGGGANHNVSEESPLADAAILIGGLAAVLFLAYWLLGLLVQSAVPWIPVSWEDRLGEMLSPPGIETVSSERRESSVREILRRLEGALPESRPPIRLTIAADSTVNVVALPGRRIIVFRGFLDQAASMNEVAMVLAHELGHFENRDHLRALGRALVPALLLGLVGGDHGDASGLMQGTLTLAALHFSREQEAEADAFGVDLLVRVYGHAGGAVDFFDRNRGTELDPGSFAFMATHPSDENRVALLRKRISERAYVLGDTAPLE